MIIRFLIAALLIVCVQSNALAYKLSERALTDMVLQIEGVMNKRSRRDFEKFFNFYATFDSRFIKNSSLIDPVTGDVVDTQMLNMSREEYVDYLDGILSSPYEYKYRSSITGMQISDNKEEALVSIHIEDMALSREYDEEAFENKKFETKTYANCNIKVIVAAANPMIVGSNCVEKIVSREVVEKEDKVEPLQDPLGEIPEALPQEEQQENPQQEL